MTTLRRERIQKFREIVCKSEIYMQCRLDIDALEDELGMLLSALADAAASRTEVRGIEAAMFGERKVTESDLPIGDEALKAFERDLQCPGSWSWYPAKSSDEPAWKSLREFVVKTYQSDPKAFEKYYTWARDPFSRGAKLPIHIRQDPTCFEYAWQAYQAANPGQVNSTGKVTTDKHGIVESW